MHDVESLKKRADRRGWILRQPRRPHPEAFEGYWLIADPESTAGDPPITMFYAVTLDEAEALLNGQLGSFAEWSETKRPNRTPRE